MELSHKTKQLEANIRYKGKIWMFLLSEIKNNILVSILNSPILKGLINYNQAGKWNKRCTEGKNYYYYFGVHK